MDWHRARLTSRRLAVLIRHLPRDSALHRELHGEAAEWTVTDYLLAHAVDQLSEANWMFATVNRDEEAEPLPHPEPIPRPGTTVPRTEEKGRSAGPAATELTSFFS
ncbi:hypothetical protein AB0I84_08710 [Streptomyces spectabilis]